MLKLWVSETEFLSTTFTVKFAVPALDGVPLIWAADKINPWGSEPPDIDHVYGAVPPLTCRVCEYATPTCPPGNVLVVIARAGDTTILKAWVSLSFFPSAPATFTIKLDVPADFGDPLIVPLLDNVRPEGKLPPEMVQV